MLTLTLKNTTGLPIELQGIVPAALSEQSSKQIERISIGYGNQSVSLGDLFAVKGSCADGQLTFWGELSSAVGIGAGMQSGLLRVDGNAGHDVGLGMGGGTIEVTGNAGDNLGAEMRGGLIRLRGCAGSNTGGTLPGSRHGMAGGIILIDSDADDFLGRRMRRGLIAIRGRAGNYLGHGMLAGSIMTGECGAYPGTEMSRGTICVGDSNKAKLLASFRHACTAHAPVLGMIGRQLQSLGFENDLWNAKRRWTQFNGDALISGRGELFTATDE